MLSCGPIRNSVLKVLSAVFFLGVAQQTYTTVTSITHSLVTGTTIRALTGVVEGLSNGVAYGLIMNQLLPETIKTIKIDLRNQNVPPHVIENHINTATGVATLSFFLYVIITSCCESQTRAAIVQEETESNPTAHNKILLAQTARVTSWIASFIALQYLAPRLFKNLYPDTTVTYLFQRGGELLTDLLYRVTHNT